jgi:hypothetical protein
MNEKERIQSAKDKLGTAMKALVDLQLGVWELEIDALTRKDDSLTPEVIDAYWRLKEHFKQHTPISRVLVLELLQSLAAIIGDEDWPDLTVFDKLFIDKKDA